MFSAEMFVMVAKSKLVAEFCGILSKISIRFFVTLSRFSVMKVGLQESHLGKTHLEDFH